MSLSLSPDFAMSLSLSGEAASDDRAEGAQISVLVAGNYGPAGRQGGQGGM